MNNTKEPNVPQHGGKHIICKTEFNASCAQAQRSLQNYNIITRYMNNKTSACMYKCSMTTILYKGVQRGQG